LKHWGISDDCISRLHLWDEETEKIIQFMEKEKRGLFLYGDQGRGKTTFVASILNYELKRFFDNKSPYKSIQFVFVPDLLEELKSCFAQDSSKLSGDVICKYSEYDFLVLDGMGEGGKQTEFVIGALGTLIHHRDANRLTRRTLVTCNWDLKVLADRTDARISSRISGMCEGYEVVGEDHREKR